MRSHGIERDDAAVMIGRMCGYCGKKPARVSSDYCTASCGKKAGGLRVSEQRQNEDPAQRIAAYRQTMEDKRGYAITEASVVAEIKALGFEVRDNDYPKLTLVCQSNHESLRDVNEFKRNPTCIACKENDRKDQREKEARAAAALHGMTAARVGVSTFAFTCALGHTANKTIHAFTTYPGCATCKRNERVEAFREELKGFGLTLIKYKNQKATVRCRENHETRRSMVSFRKTGMCHVCNMSTYRYTVDKVRSALHDGYTLTEEPETNKWGFMRRRAYISLRCDKGHDYRAQAFYLVYDKTRCPVCNTSKPEYELGEKLAQHVEIERSNRTLIHPQELDIVIPKHKVAVEMCGLYWHSEAINPEKDYHAQKLAACEAVGYRLLTVFSDEWETRPDVCLSRILHACGLNERVGARKCTVVEVPTADANNFFDRYHLQGRPNATKAAWGLVHEGELVACLSVGAPTRAHTSTNATIEMKRMATKPYVSIPGGLARLLKKAEHWCKENGYTQIKSYCDRRWGTGGGYAAMDFDLKTQGKPIYWYTDGTERKSAFALRKTPQERETGLTELELRIQQGYTRIWDCGHQTWVKQL